jgi:hypothetical protein
LRFRHGDLRRFLRCGVALQSYARENASQDKRPFDEFRFHVSAFCVGLTKSQLIAVALDGDRWQTLTIFRENKKAAGKSIPAAVISAARIPAKPLNNAQIGGLLF